MLDFKKKLLVLDLQEFAEKAEDSPEGEEGGEVLPKAPDGAEKAEELEGAGKKIPYDRFKEKVDEVNELKRRLDGIEEAKELERQEELKEQEKYKELYEEALEKMSSAEEARRELTKRSALVEVGYDEEQVELMLKLVKGDTDEEVAESIETLKKTFPIRKNYVDPSADNGGRATPKKVDGEDYGKDMFKRLFEKGKLRGFKK